MKWQARRALFWRELGNLVETQARATMADVDPSKVPAGQREALADWLAQMRALAVLVEQQARHQIAELQARAAVLERRAHSTTGAGQPARKRARARPRPAGKAAVK